MRATVVIEAYMVPNGSSGLADFDEDMVSSPAFSGRFDLNLSVGQHLDTPHRSEVAALIRAKDFGGTILCYLFS